MGNNNVKALKSGIWYTAANFLVNGIGLITTPIFSRLLTHTDFGAYSNYASWLSIFSLITTLNLETSFISARFEFEDRFEQYVLSSLVLSSISIVTWFAVINVAYKQIQHLLNIDRIFINCMMVYLLLRTAVHMFQIQERYYYRYKNSVFISLVIAIGTAVISVLLVVIMKDKLAGRIFGSVIPTVIIGLFIYGHILTKGKKIDTTFWKYAIPICLPYIPHLLSMTLLGNMDRIMITQICGESDTALYTLAYNCGAVVTILLTSLNTAYTPWLGEKLHNKSYSEIRNFSKKYVICFVYLTIGIMMLTPELLLILGGKSYMEAKRVMPPVTCGIAFQFLYTLFVNVEQYNKKTFGMAFGSVSAALLNYVLNLYFIPRYGYPAAAYTTLAGYIWLLCVHMILVKRIHFDHVYDYKFIIFVAVMMNVLTIGVNFLYKNNTIRMIGIIFYLVISFVTVVKNKEMIFKFYYKLKAR